MPPELIFHERTGQPRTCLRGLARYAARIAQSRLTDRFETAAEVRDWIWRQPILLDDGTGLSEPGCKPAQRSRIWPKDGLNCWEATAHWLGWHLRRGSDIEVHLFDSYVRGQRHVFPAARFRGDTAAPAPIVLQPPYVLQARKTVEARLQTAAQALGPLPPPLQLLRRVDFFIDFDLNRLIAEAGGDLSRGYRGVLPEPVLRALPPAWRSRELALWPTAAGDLLFLIVERPFFLGEATAYVIRAPGTAVQPDAPRSGSSVPAGAPPANAAFAACGSEQYSWLGPNARPSPRANAVENDILGGFHFVGDKVLRIFGLGSVSDSLADVEGDALPDAARTEEQRLKRKQASRPQAPATPAPASPPTPKAADPEAAQEQQREAERAAQVAETQRLTQEVFRLQEAERRRNQQEIEQAASRYLAESDETPFQLDPVPDDFTLAPELDELSP